jgi:endonuclease YncB( thermonuclease family)
MAWVYREYSKDQELFRLAEEAKAKGLGLWADPSPIPPWEWRRDMLDFKEQLRNGWQ